jgi:glycosyltransferase involved in cell wall biosynthesis
MRILLISRDYFPSVGGIQSHVENLYKYYQKKSGIEVFLLSRSYEGYEEEDEAIYRISNGEIRYIHALQYVINGRKQLASLHKKYRFDAIHWHDLFFDSLITKQKLPGAVKVFTNHSSGFLEWFEIPKKRKFLQWLLRHSDIILSPSEEINEKTKKLNLSATCSYIPNGVDTDKFYPGDRIEKVSDIRNRFNFSADDFVVLCPRRLEPKNGVNYFVESAKYFNCSAKKPKYLVVGGGYPEERQKMEDYIRVNGIENVSFAGSVSNQEMLNYYQAADLVVLPSLMEATSISGLEAMACGLPIVGTTVGGIPALIRDGENGFLVPPRNSKAIYEKVKQLMADPLRTRSFALKSRCFAEQKFSWVSITDEVVSKYKIKTV